MAGSTVQLQTIMAGNRLSHHTKSVPGLLLQAVDHGHGRVIEHALLCGTQEQLHIAALLLSEVWGHINTFDRVSNRHLAAEGRHTPGLLLRVIVVIIIVSVMWPRDCSARTTDSEYSLATPRTP